MKKTHLEIRQRCKSHFWLLVVMAANFALHGAIEPAFAEDAPTKPVTLQEVLDQRVTGLTQAKEELISFISQRINQTTASNRAAVMMIYGPNVGKATLIETAAYAMAYSSYRVPIELIAQPYPEVLFEELATQLAKDPKTFVIFPNFELASKEIQGALIGLIDSQQVTTGDVAVSAEKAMFYITTTHGTGLVNAIAAHEIRDPVPVGFKDPSKRMYVESLPEVHQNRLPKVVAAATSFSAMKKAEMSEALLERINVIAPAFPPSEAEFLEHFIREFTASMNRFRELRGVRLDIEVKNLTAALGEIIARYYRTDMTVAEIRRIVDKLLNDQLSDAVLAGYVRSGLKLHIQFNQGVFKVDCKELVRVPRAD